MVDTKRSVQNVICDNLSGGKFQILLDNALMTRA